MEQININGQAAGSIWKATDPKPQTKTPVTKNPKHESSRRAAPFIPESYSDPTASAALRNLIREEERMEQEKRRANKRRKKRKKAPKTP